MQSNEGSGSEAGGVVERAQHGLSPGGADDRGAAGRTTAVTDPDPRSADSAAHSRMVVGGVALVVSRGPHWTAPSASRHSQGGRGRRGDTQRNEKLSPP